MNAASLLLSDYLTIAVLLGLWVMLGSNAHLKRQTIRATRIVILLIFAEAIFSIIERWTRGLDHLTYARLILIPTVYLLHPVIMLGIMYMAEIAKKYRFLLYLPVLISAPLLYSSQWTHLIYWFSPDNQYHAAAGVMRNYPYFLFLFYIILFVGAFIVRYVRRSTTESKGVLVSIAVAAVGVVFCVFLRIEVDYSLLFATLLLIYYLSLYVLTAKEDPLTLLLNRQCYYADSKNLRDQITAVVSVDMNDLKKLNDFQGHDAGDKALKTVAECLTSSKLKNKRVYRIGGDEFAIFYLGKTGDEVNSDIECMRAELAKTEYVCAFGCKTVTDKDVNEAILEADREMYKNKAVLKDSEERRIAAHKEATIRVMHEALGSGMWGMEFDEEGRLSSVEWSPEFRRMIGYTNEEDFPNRLESWSDLLHPDDKSKVMKEFNDTIMDYSGQKNYDVEYRLKVKSGEWKWFHAIGRLLRRENGVPLSYVGMFVDISEQKKDGQQRQRAV